MLPVQQVQNEKISKTELRNERRIAKNRGRIDVVADVIRSCERASTKSHIMLVANINSIVATRMIANLIGTSLIDSVHDEGGILYLATPKGLEFLRKYSELVLLLSPELIPSKSNNCNRPESLIF
jgi:predicted transcriptional regulator